MIDHLSVPVRDMARNEEQQHSRQKLREADKPQVERSLGQRVDLPGDGNSLYLQPELDDEPRRHVVAEVRILKCDAWAVVDGGR